MAKIKLGNRPKTFKPVTLTVALPEGGEGKFQVTYKYFTKTESGKLIDGLIADARKEDESVAGQESPEFSMEAVMNRNRDGNAAYILKVLDAWSLDEDLTLENLQQLDDELPAATIAIMDGFRNATQQGRLGN